MADKITVKDFAKLVNVHPERVKIYCKQGLPFERVPVPRGGKPPLMIDPEAGVAWMVANGRGGYAKTAQRNAEASVGASSSPIAVPVADTSPRPSLQLDNSPGLVGAANRLRASELIAFQEYLRARNSGNIVLEKARLATYVDTCKALKSIESVLDERSKTEAEIRDKVLRYVADWSEGIRSFLDSLPTSCASRLNPSDPAMAESVLRDVLATQLLPLMAREVVPNAV